MKANEAIQIQEKKLILKIRVLVLFYIFALFFWGDNSISDRDGAENYMRSAWYIFGCVS